MEKAITIINGVLPTLIKNTHFNISLQGWPAAASVIAICFAGSTIYTIRSITSD